MLTAVTKDLKEYQLRKRLKAEFPFYAAKILKIRTKSGEIKPFVLNQAQRYLHGRVEAQLKETGKVRVLLLKGRQWGGSTYVGGRYFHIDTHNKGIRTFILTHDADATANLFGMVQRFYEHTPSELRPHLGASNRKELLFDVLDSGYQVGTAGTKGVGRSNTIQLLHGSEVAFWPHADEHSAGILQAVPNAPGTEIILESTANGEGNFFHQQWNLAVAGKSDYIAIFIPWYWQKEYRSPVPEGFVPTIEELQYKKLYNLDLEQIVWRRKKTVELKDDPALFKQEYPANPKEAFQFSKTESFIKPEVVLRARKQQQYRSFGAVVAGFDPKRDGADSYAFIYRQSLNAFGLEYPELADTPAAVAFCKRKLQAKTPYIDMLFIDYGGSGWEIAGFLRQDGFGDRIRVVNFGAKARNPLAYYLRRSEMWGEMKNWLVNTDEPPSIPDDDRLQAGLVTPGFDSDHGHKQQLAIESKKDIKGRGLPSPDGGDALGLTFAEPFVRDHVQGSSAPGQAITDFDVHGG